MLITSHEIVFDFDVVGDGLCVMSEFVIVETEYGKVRGIRKVSALNTAYSAFLGIRYATAPVGDLRFKDALPPLKWQNVYDATEEKSPSVGHNFYTKKVVGSEDSLFLNIFTKDIEPEKLQPVLIYIHGGGFNGGSSSTDMLGPDYFLMADVVLVTLNYRLGALGFLSLKDESLKVPGNAALKDQLMAMKFVKNNIENFGGDPNNITLFGQSAGGGSVSWHCVSERSKGLFQKAFIMAGCILNKFSLTPQRDWANRLARKLGYNGNEDEKKILEFLQKADVYEIVKVQDSLMEGDEKTKISMAFGPHIEHYKTEETFNSEYPIDLVRKAWSNDIDVMIGGNSDEGLMYLEYVRQSPSLLKSFNLESQVPTELNLGADDPMRKSFAEKMRKIYYPNGTDPTVDESGLIKIKSDQSLWHGMQRLIQSRQNSETLGRKGKTFMYRFAVDSPTQNYYRISHLAPETRGVCHSDELSYLFKSIHIDVPEKDSMEFKSIQRFVSLFTSFATTGDPNDNVIKAEFNGVHWSPVDTFVPPFSCLNIEENLKFEVFPESERLAIWDELYLETKTPLY